MRGPFFCAQHGRNLVVKDQAIADRAVIRLIRAYLGTVYEDRTLCRLR
jgi:hypothetical protein